MGGQDPGIWRTFMCRGREIDRQGDLMAAAEVERKGAALDIGDLWCGRAEQAHMGSQSLFDWQAIKQRGADVLRRARHPEACLKMMKQRAAQFFIHKVNAPELEVCREGPTEMSDSKEVQISKETAKESSQEQGNHQIYSAKDLGASRNQQQSEIGEPQVDPVHVSPCGTDEANVGEVQKFSHVQNLNQCTRGYRSKKAWIRKTQPGNLPDKGKNAGASASVSTEEKDMDVDPNKTAAAGLKDIRRSATQSTRQDISGNQISNLNCLSWNCRGGGNAITIRDLESLTKANDSRIVFLCETRQREERMRRHCRRLGLRGFTGVSSNGNSGGLALYWDDSLFVEVQDTSDRYIDAHVRVSPEDPLWRLTCVYGEPKAENRHHMWSKLQELKQKSNLPWLIVGDFNEALWQFEHFSTIPRPENQMVAFREVLAVCELRDIGFSGLPYTLQVTHEALEPKYLGLPTPDGRMTKHKFQNLACH